MSTEIYIEGGGDSEQLHARCRKGFRELLERCGFAGRLPVLFACGGRLAVFDDFREAHASRQRGDYIAMWVDSEEPMDDAEKAWEHLKRRDRWDRPDGAQDDQVLLMTTCMETWIVADRPTLRSHYRRLREKMLPPLHDLEGRHRHDVQDKLCKATRDCTNAYTKGKRSFEVLGKLAPDELDKHLPSFRRVRRILKKKL